MDPLSYADDLDQGFEPLSDGGSLAEAASVAEAVLRDVSAHPVVVDLIDGEEDPVVEGASEDVASPIVLDEHFNQLDELPSQSHSSSILTNCGPVEASSGGESVYSQISSISNSVGNDNGNVNDNVGNGNSFNDSDNVDNDNGGSIGGNVNFYGSVVTLDDASTSPGTYSQDSEMFQASGPCKRLIATGNKNKTKAKKISTGHLPGSIASAARLAVSRSKK